MVLWGVFVRVCVCLCVLLPEPWGCLQHDRGFYPAEAECDPTLCVSEVALGLITVGQA